jgi:hypothetical protein
VEKMAAMSEILVDKTPDGGFRNDHMARMGDYTTIVLDLEGQELGDDGAMEIAEGLKTNKTLQVLKLTDNGISDVGAVAIANALKQNSTLTHLSLQDNDVTNEGAVAISEALDVNKVRSLALFFIFTIFISSLSHTLSFFSFFQGT